METVGVDTVCVKFGGGEVSQVRWKEVAFINPHQVRLPVGTRCVAVYNDKEQVEMYRLASR